MDKKDEKGKESRGWRNPNFPFPMSFPMRIFSYIVVDLTLINLLVLYLIGNVPLGLVLLVDVLEIVVLTLSMAFWVSPYKLKW